MSRMVTPKRLIPFVSIHLLFIALAISCNPDSIGHGTFSLTVPNSEYGQVDIRDVDFFLDEPVGAGTFTGWVQGSGCEAWVYLCDEGYCETIFHEYVDVGEEIMFEISSYDSIVFDNYLEKFLPCYKDNEFASEPFSCQKWTCGESEHTITIMLESGCQTSMLCEMDVEYLDVRVPFLSVCAACAALEEFDECDGYECEDYYDEEIY